MHSLERWHAEAGERLDADRSGVDLLVLDHAGLDLRGDGGVVNVGANGLLAAGHCAAGGGDHWRARR